MRKCDPIGLAKAILWEETKGKLRALLAADGAEIGGTVTEEDEERFEAMELMVNNFISGFENEGYHE